MKPEQHNAEGKATEGKDTEELLGNLRKRGEPEKENSFLIQHLKYRGVSLNEGQRLLPLIENGKGLSIKK